MYSCSGVTQIKTGARQIPRWRGEMLIGIFLMCRGFPDNDVTTSRHTGRGFYSFSKRRVSKNAHASDRSSCEWTFFFRLVGGLCRRSFFHFADLFDAFGRRLALHHRELVAVIVEGTGIVVVGSAFHVLNLPARVGHCLSQQNKFGADSADHGFSRHKDGTGMPADLV
jgi:hypothetical protein